VFRAIIAEGTQAFRQVLLNIFHSRFPSVEWAEAANGKDATGLIETFFPDLILIDIRLPGGNALELTRMIKMHHPDVVVIILGSYDFPEYRDMAYLNGADYFICKDSSLEDHVALIQSVLSARSLGKEVQNGDILKSNVV
jgi:DNA-binding NarL/FixJ family response regulator